MKIYKSLIFKIGLGVIFFIALSLNSNTVSAAYKTVDMSKELTFEEAVDMLGITDTTGLNGNVIKLENNTNLRTMPDALEAGNIYYEDLNLTRSMTGRARQYFGDEFCWGIAVGEGSVQLVIETRSYDSYWMFNEVAHAEIVSPGYQYTSEFVPITRGQYYYFKYGLHSYGGPACTDSVAFRIAVAVL